MPADEPLIYLTGMCETCIYRKDESGQLGGLMHLRPGRTESMTAETIETDSNVICHKSYGVSGEWAENAYCHGNVKAKGPGQMMRITGRLGMLRNVHPKDMAPGSGEAPDEEE